jgi:hypothetical protein
MYTRIALAALILATAALIGSPHPMWAPSTTDGLGPVVLAALASGPVTSHECPDCGGSDRCKHCIGTGASGNPMYSAQSCSSCQGTGTCQSCLEADQIRPGLRLVRK